MLSCIAAALGVGEIILIVACVAVVLGVVTGIIIRKKKGKCACCDECSEACPHCASKENSTKNK